MAESVSVLTLRVARPRGGGREVSALERLGFSWGRLERLARRALNDRMRDRGVVLDAERYQEAFDWYVDVGAEWALRFDPLLANGVSFSTSCYRRMYPRLADYLRERHGDERRGVPLVEVAVERMPDGVVEQERSLVQVAAELGAGLSERCRWTLELLAVPIADGELLHVAAERAGVSVELAEELLEELGWRLGLRSAPAVARRPVSVADWRVSA